MKRSWKKKASVWTMAAAMTVSYIPQYSFAEETTENIKQETQTQTIEEQTILGNLTSEALATESIPETSLQIPTESSSESVPETSSQEPSESITPTSSQEESSTQESTPQSSAEASTEEETSEEETSEEESTEETTEETTPEETTTEEPEWSEQAPKEDTKGLTFSFSEDGQTVSITGFDGSRSVVEIPETYGGAKVTSIAAGAFRGQTMITDVVIPEGVTYIGREAFAGCSALVRVQIPTSVTQVGANLFEGTPYDSTLTGELVYINSILYRCQSDAVTVSIRQGTTVIAEEAFINRVNLAAIVVPDGVSYIGSNAFKNCSALSQIEIPKSVRDIVANAFDGTKWYEDRKHEMIYINDLLYRVPAEIIVQSEQPTGSLSDKDAAELAKSGVATQLVPYTDVIVQGGTTTICTLAFANTPVQKVQLPSTLTTIRYGAFQNCTALKQITLPESMTFLGASAFSGCTSLTSATLPQAITRISSGLFENCSSLTTVQASSALTSIGSRAFAETSALSSFTFPQTLTAVGAESFTGSGIVTANLPQSVTYLGAGAFADCTKLVYAQVPAAIQAVRERTFRNCTELKNVSIPEGIRYIGAAAFQNDVSLQTVDFAQSLLTICDNAFEGSGVGEGLVLPPALRTIGSRAFAGCMRLTSLTIPADIRKMGSQAFADGSSPSIVCAFSRTTYMSKLASGWVADWGSGLGALTFTGGAVNDEQKAAFLQMICKLVPDFNASEANNTLYSGIIGRLGVSAKAGGEAASLLGIVSEQAQEGWIRIPELSTRRAILNLTGIWMQDYCPANTGVEDVYYADGWYYINEVSFAETLTKGYLPKGQNGSGYTFFDSYDAPTGMMDGAVTVLLSESDNDYGIAAQVRSSEKITDGRYINVYESVEERELSESIKDIWMTESASYQFDNYSRILTVQSLVSPDAGIDTHFRYSCKPGEDDGTFTMEWKGMDEANIDQVRTFTVSVDEETQAMKLTDAQTQEEITLNSIAQQANQPTMSGQ